jgi:hypothetical protein
MPKLDTDISENVNNNVDVTIGKSAALPNGKWQ